MVRRTKFRNFSGGLHLKKVSWGRGFLRLMMLAALIATLGLVAAPVAPVSGEEDYSDWQYRQTVIINHARIGATSDLIATADLGTIKIFVESVELFSKGDSVLLVDDLNSEVLEVFSAKAGIVKTTTLLVNSYTVANHAYLKNVSNPGSELIDFPVLVQITDSTNPIFDNAQGRDDILFTDVNGTKLPHEIEYYNDSSGSEELDAWVRVLIISASADTALYMYYGNVDYGKPGWLSPEDAENVWSEDYVMVQHLQETERGGGDDFDDHLDSTSNDNDGELFAGNSIWGVNITIDEYDKDYYLGHDPINTYPEPAVFIIGLKTKWSYDYYDEGEDWEINYEDGMFKALEDGIIPLGKPCNICYSYPDPEEPNVGATMNVTGKIAGADFFDGIDDAIDFYKNDNVWNIADEITISAWVNLQWRARLGPWEMDNPDYVIASSGTGYELCLWTDIEEFPPDPVEFVPDGWFQIIDEYDEVKQYDCCPDPVYPNIAVLIDKWYLLTVVYDGTTMYSYVNSELDASMDASPAGLIDGEPDDGLFVGMCSDLDAPLFGIIDEVRILKKGRDAEWIKACYNNQEYPASFCRFVIPLLGETIAPTDPDGDGLCEDLSANGQLDFKDLVLFFTHLEWIGAHEPIPCFDFSGNGLIDFKDLVLLFDML